MTAPVKRIPFKFTPKQKIFYADPHRFKVMAKGRRFGATMSEAKNLIKTMIRFQGSKSAWFDTTYRRMISYVNEYFIPVLGKMQLPEGYWSWNGTTKQLKIGTSILDFFSADKPQNIEGGGYGFGGGMVLNEAGIILENRKLWQISILPMAMDGSAWVHFIGTPKGKFDSEGQETLYFEQYKKGQDPANKNWKSFQFSSYDNLIENGGYLKPEELQMVIDEQPVEIQPQEILGQFIDIKEKRVFRRDWFEVVDSAPDDTFIQQKIMSMDTAMKVNDDSDDSAVLVIYKTVDSYYIINCLCDKFEFPELRKETIAMAELWKPDAVLIEDCASGTPLIQSLKASVMPVLAIRPDANKLVRARAVAPTCQARKIKLVKGEWNSKFINQLCSFPSGHDDIVDSFTMAINWFKDYGPTVPMEEYVTAKLDLTPNYMMGF